LLRRGEVLKAEELKELSKEELKQRVTGLRKDMLKLKFDRAKGELKNVTALRSIRRDIARALTVLNQKNKGGEK